MKLIEVRTDEQLQTAFKIRKDVFVHEQNVPEQLEIDEYENDAMHFLLLNNNEAIGAGRLRSFPNYSKVERICILKSERKNGAGSKLMTGIENYAVSKGVKKLVLNAQVSAIPFYKKLGYQVSSETFLDANIRHKTMEKLIYL